jgi:hypothetical protein
MPKLEASRLPRAKSVFAIDAKRDEVTKAMLANGDKNFDIEIDVSGNKIVQVNQMNVILEGTTEFRNNAPSKNLGNVVLRGSNILYICVEHPEETK